MTRQPIPQRVRNAVFERDGNKCVFCGIGESLQLMHLIPLSDHVTSNSDIDNLLTVCANCHCRMDQGQIRGFEFESFVERLLRSATGRYSDVARESQHQGIMVDVSAIDDNGRILIECKAVFAIVDERFKEILARMAHLKTNNPAARVVLAMLGELTSAQRDELTDAQCEHWGPKYFVDNFPSEIQQHRSDFFAAWFGRFATAGGRDAGALSFDNQLKACATGRSAWSQYQRLVGNMLEAFFVPPLEKPISESPDGYQVNRRDFVLPNYCTTGFWAFMRERYAADYVVVDAKNYTKKIGKKEILQIANYLKEHGAGLFGVIFSRSGPDQSATITLREQWALSRKLIIVLTDADLLSMIASSKSGGNPDTILRQRVEEFRLLM